MSTRELFVAVASAAWARMLGSGTAEFLALDRNDRLLSGSGRWVASAREQRGDSVKEEGSPVKKNILIVHGQLSHGGSERQLYYLLSHCDRSAFTPHLVVSGELGYWEEPIAELGVPITLLSGSPVQKMRDVRRLARSSAADIFFSWGSYTNIYGFALLGMKVKRFGSFRNVKLEDTKYLKRTMRWAKLNGTQSIICNSRETKDSLVDDVRSSQSLHYVPNGTAAIGDGERHRTEWRDRLDIGPDEKLVVGVGRLAPQKNFFRFIDTVVEVNKSQPCRAVVVGPDKGQQADLQRKIDSSGLPPDTIRLIGEVPDAREVVCAADVFLLTSDHEGMPNVVMEAMAAGTPCVTTPVNGIPDLIEDRVHGMVGGWSEQSLAAPLIELLGDEDLRRSIATSARKRMLEEFSPKRSAERIWDLLDQ